VCQLMEKAPDKRPYDAMAVLQALERIQEKVEAQQSAGVEAAKARHIDKSALRPALDETDKDAARTLLHKKKRKKTTAFYRRGWFQGAALVAILVGVGFLFYFAFLRAPSADSLLGDIDRLAAPNNEIVDWDQAVKGPMTSFLSYYPDHPRAEEVRRRRDRLASDISERQFFNRREHNMDAGEQMADRALKKEDQGDLAAAVEQWEKLADYRNKPVDDADRGLGLMAARYLKLNQSVASKYDELKARVAKEKRTTESKKPKETKDDKETREPKETTQAKESKGEKQPEETGVEGLALRAVRAERDEAADLVQPWKQVKEAANPRSDERVYYLLAAKRLRELKKS